MPTQARLLGNRLLDALPDEVRQRLFPLLSREPLPLSKVIYEPGDTVKNVYFPTDSIISMVSMMEDGASAEIAMVGNEGVLGIAAFTGGASTPSRAIVQSAGSAYRLSSQRLNEEFNQGGELQRLLLLYTQMLITQMAQTLVCNRHHTIYQQLCRWLLLFHDRLTNKQLNLTQEMMANMLGVRREGVTHAAGRLQNQGIIRYVRGNIKILDRPELENACCECYSVIRRETERLLPYLRTAEAH